ncbi:hypothetical protein BGZ94_006514 [Podila epigama]|nr:hypothetical protein BGZ94_006514 [Podila epigama]
MASLQIKLRDAYLSVNPPSTSFSLDSSTPAPAATTSLLKGTVLITLTKPIHVASLALTLSGTTHLCNLGTTSKRAHYSRQHLRIQHFLLAPHSDHARFYTLEPHHTGSCNPSDRVFSPTASSISPSSVHCDDVHSSIGISPRLHIDGNLLSFEFEIPVPNHVPPSVMTPHGGTIYGLTATLTMAQYKNRSRLLSLINVGSGDIQHTMTVQVYRAGTLSRSVPSSTVDTMDGTAISQSPGNSSADGNHNEENVELTPASVSNIWPGQLEAKATIAYAQLPLKSTPEIKVQIKSLGQTPMDVQSLQIELWERAIYRVQKQTCRPVTRPLAPSTASSNAPASSLSVIGVKDRAVYNQSSTSAWLREQSAPSSTNSNNHPTLSKTVTFSTPTPIRGPKDLYSVRNCNPSTYSHKNAHAPSIEPTSVDSTIQDSEFGAIDIEIQHFLRCSLQVSGTSSSSSEASSSSSGSRRPALWTIGDIPVVLCGAPSGPQEDASGLPTYMGSFSTSVASLQEVATYETRLSFNSDMYRPCSYAHSSYEDSHPRQSMSSGSGPSCYYSSGELAYVDGENDGDDYDDDDDDDDALKAVLGHHHFNATLPAYEDGDGIRHSI